MSRPVIGITIGDPSGAGPEVCLKALKDADILKSCKPILFGDETVIRRVMPIVKCETQLNLLGDVGGYKDGYINLISLSNMVGDYEFGKVQPKCGRAGFEYIKAAIESARADKIDAVVTGPINKEALNKAGIHYSGHTEIFAELTGTKDYAMLLISGLLRVIHVTTHVSMREACDRIKMDRVYSVIKLANKAMKDLGIENPKVAVAGLNPHSGENGLFGDEEIKEITPAIEKAKDEGIDVSGPVSPDVVFLHCKNGKYHVVVAMYHDQGHIPVKLLDFMGGVNVTVGLPIIRTSVDHGTVFDKAGKGTADESSMIRALEMAVQFALNRSK